MEIPEGRLAKDWLGSYLALTSNLEANTNYHLWAGLTILAASLRRRVYLDMNYGRVYPNLYVIFVGESAVTRKSAAMDYAKDLYVDAFPHGKVMQDSMTSQGLIRQLNKETQVVRDGKIIKLQQSDVFIHADEVANLFSYEKTRSSNMVIFFTRTYMCPPVYDHTTVRDSLVRLFNLYPVLLGGTDPRNLKVFPDDAVAGLTGRLIWIVETTRRANQPGWKIPGDRKTLERTLLREMLIRDLKHIGNLEGEFQRTKHAQDMYDAWYDDLTSRDTKDPNTRAFYHRCHVTALHIAQLLVVSEGDELLLTERAMAAAIKLIEAQLPQITNVSMLSGGSQYEQSRSKLLMLLMNSGGVVRQKLAIRQLGLALDEFLKLRMTLVAEGTIEVPPVQAQGDVFIKLTKEGLARLA